MLNTAWAQADEPGAVPYRPSVSTPAALSQPGWLELEAGGLRTGAGGNVRRDSLPYTLKLALTPDWGIRWSGEAWVAQTDDGGQRINGGGDSAIVLKRRFAVDDKSAFGLELGTTLPTGTGAISSGQSDYSITGIYSADVG
ncbi:MAG: transporter, partial [Rhodoferax sp.]